ncbi:MAG: dockerin type I domain-containing protein [Ruminococcus sp.]|nr:dockerin type I domain-containing protein [Ruminococcus sp.]
MKRLLLKAAAAAVTAGTVASFAAPALSASAEWQKEGYIGDLNNDGTFTVADLVILTKYVLGAEGLPETGVYNMEGAYFLIGTRDEIPNLGQDDIQSGADYIQLADIDRDGVVDTFDLIALRKTVIYPDSAKLLYRWYEEQQSDFIDAPIYDLYGSMPSQGEAKVAVFTVDFPDCRFSYKPSIDEVEQATFGAADTSSRQFPLESIAAFYERSSKGAIHLSGKAFEYTAQKSKSAYEGDIFHIDIIDEVLGAFDSQIDYNDYDADKDGMIDAIMIVVPTAAGDDNWWPTSGGYGGSSNKKLDGLSIGHVIVGNQNIGAKNDYSGYCQTYSHEMGHCMGLPDYYLYGVDDFQGLHGSGGFELMDDAFGDFGAASKLMLGWYRSDQISVFDSSQGEQTFTLYNNETDSGNCVIIPRGTLGDKYRSEFFIIEYTSLDNNNLRIKDYWWKKTGTGVRVFHVEATENGNYWYPSWKYASGNDDETNYNNGRRFIRLVGEGSDSTDNLFRDGALINGSTSGYKWYGSDGSLSVDSGTSISVKQGENDTYIITVKAN